MHNINYGVLLVATILAVESLISTEEGDIGRFCAQIADLPPFGGLGTDVVVSVMGEGLDDITGTYRDT